MKMTITIIASISLAILLYFVVLSLKSRKAPVLGLQQGRLLPCPASPNCVCSEQENTGAYVAPLPLQTNAGWQQAHKAIRQLGGTIVSENDTYLHATFTTPLMRYVDDLELRLDTQQQHVHVRSASRVGRSDMGANRKRVERLRALYLSALP